MGSGTIPERFRRGTRLLSCRGVSLCVEARLASCSSSVSSESSEELSSPADFTVDGLCCFFKDGEGCSGGGEGEGEEREPEEAL